MSIALMTDVWKVNIQSAKKMILLALADSANDEGTNCFPSVATIVEKCSMSERAIQGHLQALEKTGLISRKERSGRSTNYTLNVEQIKELVLLRKRQKAAQHPELAVDNSMSTGEVIHNPSDALTPAESAGVPANPHSTHTPAEFAGVQNLHLPPQNLHPTPAESAPITIIEPSLNPKVKHQGATQRALIASAIFKVSDVDQNVWQDFVTLRRAKKAPITKTAMDGIRSEAQKAGLTYDAALRMCCERGWSGFKADWLVDKAAKRTAAAQQGETFRERDARLGRERWEQMTGQPHPDNVARRAANVIDITPQFLELAQ